MIPMKEFILSGAEYFNTLSQPVLLVENHRLLYFNRAAVRIFWPISLKEDGPLPDALAQEADGAVRIGEQDWLCQKQALPEGMLYVLRKAENHQEYHVLLNRLIGRNVSHMQALNRAIYQLEDHLVETERLRNQLELAQLRQTYAQILRTNRNMDYFCQMCPSEVAFNFPMQVVDLAGICRETYRQCQYLLETAGINLRYDSNVACVLVRGNDTLLFHLLYNLISNSAKSYQGSTGEITLRLEEVGGVGMVTVEDHGHGMSEAALRTAFDVGENPSYLLPFGLGLPLGRKIANYHGGGLFLLRKEQGMRATVSIPTTKAKYKPKETSTNQAEFLASLKIVDGTFHPALLGLSDVVPARLFVREAEA